MLESSSTGMAAGNGRVSRPAQHRTARVWWLVSLLSIAIGGYALSFYWRGSAAFPAELSESFSARPWGIYTHALFGALGLIIGPFQFRRGLLVRNRALHRNLGRVYVVSAAMTGVSGLYMSVYSFGGMTTHAGFGMLATLTLFSAIMAYRKTRARNVAAHREWMIRSFALLFAAVTLRLELPLLIVAYAGNFAPAYAIVSWLCWIPNLICAEWYIGRSRPGHASALPEPS